MIQQIIQSLKDYTTGLQLIRELKLWKYFIIPGIISFLIGAALISATYGLGDNLGATLQGYYPFEFGSNFISNIASVVGGLIIFVGGLGIFKYILMIAVSAFMTPLSEKIEEHLTGIQKPKTSFRTNVQLIFRSIRLSLSNIIKELFLTLFLAIISLIPLVGFLSSPLIFLVQSYFAGSGNMDYTMERYFSLKESKRFVKNNKGVAIGNGLVFLLLLFIPVVGLIVAAPLATAAGTVSSLRHIKKPTQPIVESDLV